MPTPTSPSRWPFRFSPRGGWGPHKPRGRSVVLLYAVMVSVLALGVLLTAGGLTYLWVFLMVPILLSALFYPARTYRWELLGYGIASLALIARHHSWEVFFHGSLTWGANLTAVGVTSELLNRLTTARVRVHEALRKSERRYRLLFERNLAGVFRATPQGRFLDCNPTYAQMMKMPGPAPVLSRCAQDFAAGPGAWEAMVSQLREVKFLLNRELSYRRADGTLGWAIENVSLLDEGTDSESIEGTLVDITERKHAEDALRDAATRDGLTGLYNRRELDRMLDAEVERAGRYARPLAVVLMDLDLFKRVNDEHGHLVGDQVLRWVAEQLESQLRATDRAARFGGEEFVMLLPETSPAEALAVAERFRVHLASKPCPVVCPQGASLCIPVTVSLGVTGMDAQTPTALDVLARADRALYQAKRSGRNRAVLEDEAVRLEVLA